MNTNIVSIIIVFVIILGSVILHELSHGIVAYLLGDHTAKDAGRLTLNPLKHIDPIMSIVVPLVLYIIGAPVFGGAKPVPVNFKNLKWREWGMSLVALAGPMMNFILALLAFLIGHFSGLLYDSGFGGLVFSEIVFINLGFMIFNLIPIPPLDGSRVLYAVSPDAVRNFLSNIEGFGFILVYLLILLFGDVFSFVMVNCTQGIIDFFYLLVGQ